MKTKATSAPSETHLTPAVVLTRELIERCRTDSGGFTSATVRAFGLNWHELKKGWTARLQGKAVTREQYRAAVDGRLITAGCFKRSRAERKAKTSKGDLRQPDLFETKPDDMAYKSALPPLRGD